MRGIYISSSTFSALLPAAGIGFLKARGYKWVPVSVLKCVCNQVICLPARYFKLLCLCGNWRCVWLRLDTFLFLHGLLHFPFLWHCELSWLPIYEPFGFFCLTASRTTTSETKELSFLQMACWGITRWRHCCKHLCIRFICPYYDNIQDIAQLWRPRSCPCYTELAVIQSSPWVGRVGRGGEGVILPKDGVIGQTFPSSIATSTYAYFCAKLIGLNFVLS